MRREISWARMMRVIAAPHSLRHPAVTAIVGFRTPAQVDGILPAAALVLTEEDVREIEAKAPAK